MKNNITTFHTACSFSWDRQLNLSLYMNKIALIISLFFLAGCTNKVPDVIDLKGNWINESITLKTELKFLNNNNCEFSSGSKIQNTGVRIPCHYRINDPFIEIYQIDQSSNTANKILIFEYDSFSNSLLLKKSDKDNKPLIFIKK